MRVRKLRRGLRAFLDDPQLFLLPFQRLLRCLNNPLTQKRCRRQPPMQTQAARYLLQADFIFQEGYLSGIIHKTTRLLLSIVSPTRQLKHWPRSCWHLTAIHILFHFLQWHSYNITFKLIRQQFPILNLDAPTPPLVHLGPYPKHGLHPLQSRQHWCQLGRQLLAHLLADLSEQEFRDHGVPLG